MRNPSFIFTLFVIGCSPQIMVDADNYNDKSFGNMTYQSVDLSIYKSPNLRSNQNSEEIVILAAS